MGRRSYMFVTAYDVIKTCPVGGYLSCIQGYAFKILVASDKSIKNLSIQLLLALKRANEPGSPVGQRIIIKKGPAKLKADPKLQGYLL